MFETKYFNKTPAKVGEQSALHGGAAPDGAAPEYQQTGSKDRYKNSTATNDHMSRRSSSQKLRKPYLNGGGNKQISLNPRNGRYTSFPTETARNTLKSPTSEPPKAR